MKVLNDKIIFVGGFINMNNLMAFLSSFASYLFVYVIFAACIVAAVFAGIAVRKNKNKKEEAATTEESAEAAV